VPSRRRSKRKRKLTHPSATPRREVPKLVPRDGRVVRVSTYAKGAAMRLMLGIWTAIVCGGLAYFIVIGLTHN
jgi:hypothetical protein